MDRPRPHRLPRSKMQAPSNWLQLTEDQRGLILEAFRRAEFLETGKACRIVVVLGPDPWVGMPAVPDAGPGPE